MSDSHHLQMDQLRVGHYVYIDLKWTDHPFAFSRFKIKSQEQIDILRSLGLPSLRYNPALSDTPAPLPTNSTDSPAVPPPDLADTALSTATSEKRALVAQMQQRRKEIERIETSFVQTAQAIRNIENTLYSRPAEAVRAASVLVSEIADSILSAPELAIHVMGDQMGGEEVYFHSLNVTMLSMMLARELQLPVEVGGALGMGALMHDIGMKDVPAKIMMKTEPLTQAERHFYELHCQYGVALGQRLHLASAALTIIREHHELFDGSGFPAKLKGENISLLSRIVSIANYYEELCNPQSVTEALTPSEALSLMFVKLKAKFDPKLLQVFIRSLGVFPPGTIVQLSNGAIGMVSTINTVKPLRPALVVYDAQVPKKEAILLDLEQQLDISITKAIRPANVPAEVYAYLSPSKRVTYYFEASGAKPR